jgi:hypothetical protein
MLEQMTFENLLNATFSLELRDGVLPCNSPELTPMNRFGLEAARVKASAAPESKKDSMTQETSGPCSSILSASASLQRSLENRLQAQLNSVGSIEYTQTWKVLVTPAGRQLLAHTASAHRTCGKDSTGEPKGFPTATVNDSSNSQYQKSGDRICLKLPGVVMLTAYPTPQEDNANNPYGHKGTCFSDLPTTCQIVAWPKTPMAGDAEVGVMEIQGGKDGKYKLRDYAHVAAFQPSPWATAAARDWKGLTRELSHEQARPQLPDNAAQVIFPWGTPRVTTNGGIPCPESTGNGCRLEDQAAMGTWMSPKASDCKSPGISQHVHLKHQAETTIFQVFLGADTPSSTAVTTKLEGYRLNPFFSAWLMGYPVKWTLAGQIAASHYAKLPRSKKVK